jgi:hypothetical protein
MRKIFLILFVLMMTVSTNAFAQSDTSPQEKVQVIDDKHEKDKQNGWSEEKVTKRLKKLGFTDEQIGYLNWDSKIEIVKDKEAKKLLSFERTSHNFDEGKVEEGGVSIASLTDDIYLNIVALDYGTSGGAPYIKLVADYNWSNMPFYTLQDGFAISWSEGWYGSSWGFTESQKKCSYYEHGCQSYYWDSNTINNAYDEDRLAGVGFKYDLTSAAYDAKGTAYAYLKGNDESKIKETNYSAFKAWYGHDKVNSNLGISIGLPRGAGVEAGVSFGGEEYTTDSTSIYNPSLSW